MLPPSVILALPALFLVTLLLLALYHTLPLIHVLPRPGPLIARLATIVPRPRLPLSRKQHLPREFFNLPPRPDTPSRDVDAAEAEERLTVGAVLGVRGKVVMLLVAQGAVALICGWMVLAAELRVGTTAVNALMGLAVLMLPSTVLTMALFATATRSVHDPPRTGLGKVLGYGGITHETILPRIAPVSTIIAVIGMVGGLIAGSIAGTVITAIAIAFASLSFALAFGARVRRRQVKRSGAIRLASGSPERDVASSMGYGEKRIHLSETELEALRDDDWVESPPRPPTPVSPFSFSKSPSLAERASSNTLHSTTPKTKSSFTSAAPSELPETGSEVNLSPWSFSQTPGVPSPSDPGHSVRSRNSRISDAPLTRTATISTGVPRGSTTSQFTQTLTSTPASALRGAGGSILGGYTPDLHRPLPRAFESLASLGNNGESSPHTFGASGSTTHGGSTAPSATGLSILHPERHAASRAASSRTLHSYYSAAIADRPDTQMSHAYSYQTPKSQIRQSRQSHRAPPPPPMPVDMPLPPTPTMARSSRQTMVDSEWHQDIDLEERGEEGLWVDEEEWVDVTGDGEELESWGRGGRGVGILGMVCVTVCTALSAPLLLIGLSDMTSTLFLVSTLLPTPLIVLTSYLLRPRPLPYPTQPHNLKKGSTTSVSTHQSRALKSESQLSLPATISPKLTPPLRKKPSVPIGEKWNKLLQSKPSISKFGYATTTNAAKRQAQDLRRQTIVGAALAAQAAKEQDEQAEQALRQNMHRRSADLWLQAGHARPASTRFERVTEMMKPSPALCMLDSDGSPEPKRMSAMNGDGAMKRMSTGVAMLSQRMSQAFGAQQGTSRAAAGEEGYEMGQFADADASMISQRRERVKVGGEARPTSTITIQITSPSKFDRRLSAVSNSDTNTSDVDESPGKSADGHEGEAVGEIQTARRGRMSAGPMLIYGGIRSPTSPVGETFVRAASARPASGQFTDAESPRKRQQSLASLHNRSASAERHLDTAAAADNTLRQPAQRRHSTSLPPHDKVSFSDLRGSLDKCGKRRHDLSIYADADEDLAQIQPEPKTAWPLVSAQHGGDDGLDLPAFPVDFASPSFSPSSQAQSQLRTPRHARREAEDAQMTDRTKSLARLTLTASAYYEDASPLSQAKIVRPSAPPSRVDEQHMASPHMHGDRTRLSTDSGMMAEDSFISEASALAHQMEDVLHMDSPTRAEFVISPQPSMVSMTGSNRSSWAVGRRPLSRASSTGSLLNRAASFGRSTSPWEFDARMQQHRYSQQLDHVQGHAPVQRQASMASIASTASGWTEASGSTYAGSGSAADYSIIDQWGVAPPVPTLPPHLRRPMSQGTFSAVVHERISEGPSAVQTPPTPSTTGTGSVPATPARPADARSGLRPSSIALPDQATLAALMPSQLNKRNSALLGRHPSIMDLRREHEISPVPEEAPATPARNTLAQQASHGHLSRASVDTPQSTVSYETDAGSYRGDERRGRDTPEFRMSKQDIERVQQLKERVKAGEDITRMSLTAPPRAQMGEEQEDRVMSDVEEGSEDQFEDASDNEEDTHQYQASAPSMPAATPPRPSRVQTEMPSAAGSFAPPTAYGRFANSDEHALGRVGKQVLSIEARAAGSWPPSPAKSFIKSAKSSKTSTAPSASSVEPPAAPAPDTDELADKADVAPEAAEPAVPAKGLRPLRLLANRPPSVIGPSRATVDAGNKPQTANKPTEDAPRRSGSLGRKSDPPSARRYGKPKSSIGPMPTLESGKKGKGSYASNASAFASKENLPLNVNGTPKATPKATPARRRGSKKGSAEPGVGSIRA